MTVSTTSFYSYNNTLCLKLDTAKMLVATQWLRSKGCRISTYSDRKTGRTQIKLLSAPNEVVGALRKKFGFFPAFAEVKQPVPAPAPKSSKPKQPVPAPAPKSSKPKQRTWATRAEYEAAMTPTPAPTPEPAAKKVVSTSSDLPIEQPPSAPITVEQLMRRTAKVLRRMAKQHEVFCPNDLRTKANRRKLAEALLPYINH